MATSADDTVVPRPTALVQATVAALDTYFFEPLAVSDLFAEAWEGATAALARAHVSPVPPAPAYPADPAAAYALHAATFPALEDLASGRVSPEDLAVAAIDELLRRRRDGHTWWLMPQTRKRARSTSRSPRTFGMIMSDVPPLTVAAVRPSGPAQRAGLHRGCKVLTVNGQPTAHLRRFAAQALLDDGDEATNTLGVLGPGGKAVVVDLRAEPVPTLISEILPGPFGMLRWDSFGRPDVVEQVREALTSFEQDGVRGWIIDMRWNTGGVSSEVSRLLLDRGRIFSRLRHNEVRSPDGTLIAMREDIDANGTALPFQRPLIILTGPGSMSGAESFAGPLQARGRATLVGERTAGLCGGAHHVVLAPGWEFWITAWETVFDAAEQRVNRIGVTPDVIVTPSLEDEAAGRDPQLDAALDILRRQTAAR